MRRLKVGDLVWWRENKIGVNMTEYPFKNTVTEIRIIGISRKGKRLVKSIDWKNVHSKALVTLDNGLSMTGGYLHNNKYNKS